MKKRVLSVVLALCLVFSLLPVTALADESPTSGTCGDNLTWKYENGTLTISGTGDMYNYSEDGTPWDSYIYSIVAVEIEPGVQSIGDYAFCWCRYLQSVTIPDSVQRMGEGVFSACSGLKSAAIPAGVQSIAEYMFYDCSSLQSVTIPDSVTSIKEGAFYGCSSLQSVTVPAGVTSIGDTAFSRCSSLQSIKIPDGVTSIGDGIFSGCSRLRSITIPDGITSIGKRAFYGCGMLQSITVPNGVQSIGGSAFYGCESLKSVIIPNSVKSVGDELFADCSGLESVTLPKGMTAIKYGTFSGCSSLQSITIPNSVKSIDEWAFSRCSSLAGVSVPENVTSIAKGAFYNCKSLASIKIPFSVVKIDSEAFSNCSGIKDVHYAGSSAQWKSVEIDQTGNEALLSASIHCSPIGVPTIKITTSAGKPKISWNKIDGAKKYKIYRSTDGENYKYLTYTTKTSYTNTKATIGTKYYYKVTAVNAGGTESGFSNIKSIKCVPATPTVTISRSSGKAKLSWNKVDGASKYYIYRSTDGKNFEYRTYTTKLNYTDSKSASGTKYYYKVKAVAVVNGTNVGSNCSTVKSIMTTLAKPAVKITTSNGKPKLSWSKVTGADKYYIYSSTDGKKFSYLTSTTKLSFTNTGAKKNTKYYYKVKAICSSSTAANSALSTVVSIKATK